jgi:soluble lytic murein transglycosylase
MGIRLVIWLTLLAGITALSTCQAPASGTTRVTPSVTPAPAPPAQARRFDPDVVRPPPDSPVGRMRAIAQESPARALEELDRLTSEAGTDGPRVFWLTARAAARAGWDQRAAELFGAVASAEHPLAPWARLERARLLLERDPAAAAAEVAPLARLDFGGRGDARDLHAAALVHAGRLDEAEPLLRALLADSTGARASVAMPLAELLAGRDRFEAKREAIALWRRVAMRAPLTRSARDAEARITEVLAALSAEEREQVGEVSPEDAFARAEALAAAMQHPQAEAAFDEVARRTEDEALRCRARLGAGRAVYYQRGQRPRAAALLARVADDCTEPDVRAWARYLAGRGYASATQREQALAQYAALEQEVPDHRLADDARFRAALVDEGRGASASMTERLRTLPEVYPNGDMHAEARFMLAWRARQEGRREEALAHLEASIHSGRGEDAEGLEGRAAYWRARVLAELDRRDDAVEAWTRLVNERPLSYYSQQALARLAEVDPEAAARARSSLGERGSPRITFAWRSEMDAPAFGRAVELFAVGEVGAARDELDQLGDLDGEMRWVEAALLDRAGAHTITVNLARRALRAFRERPPAGDHFARWRIAYPHAYAGIIEQATEGRSVPPELVRAIAREESSFQPDAVSTAHAYGLVQLIVPTARRFGRPVGLEATPTTLRDPRTNVTIGSAFMSWLWERYPQNPAVLPSAYNAGQGSTDRWLRERPDQRLDEWIEEIPYDETRRYTRRVLQTWGTYAWLDRGELPTLPATLPPAR